MVFILNYKQLNDNIKNYIKLYYTEVSNEVINIY